MKKLKVTIFLVIFSLLLFAQLLLFVLLPQGFPENTSHAVGTGWKIPDTLQVIGNAGTDVSLVRFASGEELFSGGSNSASANTPSLYQENFPWIALATLGAVAFILSVVGFHILSRRVLRPLREISDQIQLMASGEVGHPVSLQGSGELKTFADQFNRMQRSVALREKIVSRYAYHDLLTSLPNRNRLNQELENRIQTQPSSICLTKLAIKDFAEINASLGREMGDLIIMEVARWLQMVIPAANLFHLGGSSFAILDDQVTTENVDYHVNSLGQYMAKEYCYQSMSLYIEARIGVALYPVHGDSAESLQQKAAAALNSAVHSNVPGLLYDAEISNLSIQRLKLTNELKSAIDQGQLLLYYQPKLELRSQQIQSVEALVRWNHPQHGLLTADKFIPTAEQTGLIHDLSLWVIGEAIRQQGVWQDRGITLAIAVNLSAKNLRDGLFFERVQGVLAETGLGTDAISLEITESALMEDLQQSLSMLEFLQAAGFRLAIDDYGTGYSSLAQLTRLPVDELKIDRSFIQHLPYRRDHQLIVRSTIELAHNLDLQVVAEGIEDQETLTWLIDAGCDIGQGYFIGHPLPVAEFTDWLMNSHYRPGASTSEHQQPLNLD